jgi:hypothetical protein
MEYIPTLAIGVTVISAVWGHAIWLSNRFAYIQKAMDQRFEILMEKLTEKLEYHERHDDKRFGDISNGLWEIRLQNAVQSRRLAAKKEEATDSRKGGTPEDM